MDIQNIISLICALLGASGLIGMFLIKGQVKRQNIDNLGLMQEQYNRVLTDNENLRKKNSKLEETITKLEIKILKLESQIPKIPVRGEDGKFKKTEEKPEQPE